MTHVAVQPEVEELIEEKNWQALRDALAAWPPTEVADLLMALDDLDAVLLFRSLPRDQAAAAFALMEREKKESLLYSLQENETRDLLAHLAPDDRTHTNSPKLLCIKGGHPALDADTTEGTDERRELIQNDGKPIGSGSSGSGEPAGLRKSFQGKWPS